MRLAVFTNQFPGPVCTFFARDMRGLINAGIEIDIFPVYPLDPTLWRYVPDTLNETILPRTKIHHLTLWESLRTIRWNGNQTLIRFVGDTLSISANALGHGAQAFAKNAYVFLKALAWAQQYVSQFDHVLAYWGNHAATCAYLFHRLSGEKMPFSIFLHASIDLYQESIYMPQKLLYADHIITCSEFNREFICRKFSHLERSIPKKLYVHYHGLDFSQLCVVTEDRSQNKVIAVGRFAKQKGFDYLLRAFRELKHRAVNVELELVGDGEEAGSLQFLARELDIMDRIKFRGWLPADEVPSAIGQATMLVHPSPDLGDGVPNVIKEAMAVGTPVIGSRIAGIPELLDEGKCGVLIPPKDIKELADAIQSMLLNKTVRQEYADAARKRAEEKFDLWQNGLGLAAILGQR